MNKPGTVYFMANRKNGAIYTGVTSDLVKRIYQHRNGLIDGFTKEHDCKKLVWFEAYDDLDQARSRELQIKKWKRNWKIKRIEENNPDWKDLWFAIAK
ncbi:Excinuclease ABC, C subunit-like [hydrothermal vent metagenome]|uniref:Excinuclease ABC, C subunit-like n=1 Tax=hydrothermal vent metagenome TaxID=652676 RepID=A0A3B0RR63_9ZZZZ